VTEDMIVSHQERLDELGAAVWFHGQPDALGQQVVMRVPLGPYYALFGRGAFLGSSAAWRGFSR
jgi:hypothetical protein